MDNIKTKHKFLIKLIALILVCLFTIDTISWAAPSSYNVLPATDKNNLAKWTSFELLKSEGINDPFKVMAEAALGANRFLSGPIDEVHGYLIEKEQDKGKRQIEFLPNPEIDTARGVVTARFKVIGRDDITFEVKFKSGEGILSIKKVETTQDKETSKGHFSGVMDAGWLENFAIKDSTNHFRALKLKGERNALDVSREKSIRQKFTKRVFEDEENESCKFEIITSELKELAEGLFLTEGEIGDLLNKAFSALGEMGIDTSRLERKRILIALLEENASQYLFEDCEDNNFIGINRTLLKIIKETAMTDSELAKKIGHILFIAGVAHELRHEAGLKDEDFTFDGVLLNSLCQEVSVDINKLKEVLVKHTKENTEFLEEIVSMASGDDVEIIRDEKITHINIRGPDDKKEAEVGQRPHMLKRLFIRFLGLLASVSGRKVSYTEFFNSLKQFDPAHILLINGIEEGDGSLGDGLVFYKPIIELFLNMYPKARITVVASNPELWNQRHSRLNFISTDEFRLLYSSDEKKFESRLKMFKGKLSIDLVVNMSWKFFPRWTAGLKRIFPNYLAVNDGLGALVRHNGSAARFPLNPWRKYAFSRMEPYASQANNVVAEALQGRPDVSGNIVLDITEQDRALLGKLIGDIKEPTLLLNFFSSRPRKDWLNISSIKRFLEEVTLRDNLQVIIPCSRTPGEHAFIEKLMSSLPEAVRSKIIIPRENGIHILKLLVHRADHIVTVDTSVGHLAANLGKSPIVLYNTNFFRSPMSFRLYWLPSAAVKEQGDYVTSFFASGYSWKDILFKLRKQRNQEMPAPKYTELLRRYMKWAGLTALITGAIDQGTKGVVEKFVEPTTELPKAMFAIGNHLNREATISIGWHISIIWVSLVMSFIVLTAKTRPILARVMAVGLGLSIGGGLSNNMDFRLLRGGILDWLFLKLEAFTSHSQVTLIFNLADLAAVLGFVFCVFPMGYLICLKLYNMIIGVRPVPDSKTGHFSGVMGVDQVRKLALDSNTTAQKLIDYLIPGHEGQIDLVIEILKEAGQKEKLLQFERILIQKLPDRVLVLRYQEALKQLSPRQNEVLAKLFIGNKTTAQIVQELRIGATTVSSYKIEGLKSLRKLLDPGSDYQIVLRNKDLLNRLSPQRRVVLTALYIENKTPAQIAQELGIGEPAVSNCKKAGLKSLRRRLDPNSNYQIVIRNQNLLDRLSQRQRIVLTKLYLEGRTSSQVSQELGISEVARSLRKTKGLKLLRKLLNPNSGYQIVVRNKELLDQLSPRERGALKGLFLENKRGAKLAQELGIKEVTVHEYKRQGLRRLRKILANREYEEYLLGTFGSRVVFAGEPKDPTKAPLDLEFLGVKRLALLLPGGRILLHPNLKDSQTSELLPVIIHEAIEALLQVIEHEDSLKYQHMKELILNNILPNENALRAYGIAGGDLNLPYKLMANDILATYFTFHLLKRDFPPEARAFFKLMERIVNEKRHSYFTREFFDFNEMRRKLTQALTAEAITHSAAMTDINGTKDNLGVRPGPDSKTADQHPSGMMGVDQVRELALDPNITAQKLIDHLIPGHEGRIKLVKDILRDAGLTEKLSEFEKLLAVKMLEKILDTQPEARLPHKVFTEEVLPLLCRVNDWSKNNAMLVDLYNITSFAGRYNLLAKVDDGKRIPPFLLGKLAVMVGNEYEHTHQNQWDILLQDNKAEFETFSPRLKESLKKKWVKGLGYTASEFSAFIKLIHRTLQESDPSEQEMLERHVYAFLEAEETYFSAFVRLAGSPFGAYLAEPFSDYVGLRSFDKTVRWVKAYQGLVDLRAIAGDSNRPFLDELESHICQLENDELKLEKLERLGEEVKTLIWIIHGKLGMELKEDLLRRTLRESPPPLKGELPDEVRKVVNEYMALFKDGSQEEAEGFLVHKLDSVVLIEQGKSGRLSPQVKQAQPPAQTDKKDAQLALREFICMKALDIYNLQKELGLEHTDLSHPRIQAALEPLMKQLEDVACVGALERVRELERSLIWIRNGAIKGEDAKETVKQLESSLHQFIMGLDPLHMIAHLDENCQGVDEFKSVYIRGIILQQFIASHALAGMMMIERIFPQEALRTEDVLVDGGFGFLRAVCLVRFFSCFYIYMHVIRKLALNYIKLGRLDLARKAYENFFKLQDSYKRYLAIIHDERLRRRALRGAKGSIEESLQWWQPRREEFNRAFERHTRYKDGANVVTAGVEMEFNVVNRQGAVIKKIGQMSIEVSDEEMKDLEWKDIKDAMREKLDGRFNLTIDEDSPELTSGLVVRDLDGIFGDFLQASPQAIEQDPVGQSPATLGRSITGIINELYLYGIERLPRAFENAFNRYPQIAYFTELTSPGEASGLFVVPDNIHINLGEGCAHAKNYLGISLFEQVFTNSEKRDNEFAAVRSIQFAEPSNGRSDNYRGKIELLTLTPRSRPFDLCGFKQYLDEEDFAFLRAHLPSQARFITTPPEVASRLKGQFEAALAGTERRLEKGEGLSLNGQTVILSFLMALISWYSKSPVGEDPSAEDVVKKFPWINASQQDAIRLYKALKENGLDAPLLDGLSFKQMMDNILHDPDFIKEYLLFFGSVPEYMALLAFAKPNAPILDISMPDAESKEALAEYPGETPETILAKWREVHTQGNVPSTPAPFATPVEKKAGYGEEPQHRLAFITSRDDLPTWGIDYLELKIAPFKKGIRVPLSSPYVKWAHDRAREFLTNPKTEPLETSSYPSARDYFPVVRDMIAANAKDDAEFKWVRRTLNSKFGQLTQHSEQEVFTGELIKAACALARRGMDIAARALVSGVINQFDIDRSGFEGASRLVFDMGTKALYPDEREGYFNRAADRFNALTQLEASCAKRGEAFERPLSLLLLILMSLYLPDVDIDADRLFKWVDASNPYRMRQLIAPLLRFGEHLLQCKEKWNDYESDLESVRGLLRRLHYELSNKGSKDWPDFHDTTNLLNVVVEGMLHGWRPLTSSALFVCLPHDDEARYPERSSYSIAHWAWQAQRELKGPIIFKPHEAFGLHLVDKINQNIPHSPQKGEVVSLAEMKDKNVVNVDLFNQDPIGNFEINFISYKENVSVLINFKAGEVLLAKQNRVDISQLLVKENLEKILGYLKGLGVAKISLTGIASIAGPFGGEEALFRELGFRRSADPFTPWILEFNQPFNGRRYLSEEEKLPFAEMGLGQHEGTINKERNTLLAAVQAALFHRLREISAGHPDDTERYNLERPCKIKKRRFPSKLEAFAFLTANALVRFREGSLRIFEKEQAIPQGTTELLLEGRAPPVEGLNYIADMVWALAISSYENKVSERNIFKLIPYFRGYDYIEYLKGLFPLDKIWERYKVKDLDILFGKDFTGLPDSIYLHAATSKPIAPIAFIWGVLDSIKKLREEFSGLPSHVYLCAAVDYSDAPRDFIKGVLDNLERLPEHFTQAKIREHFGVNDLEALLGYDFVAIPASVYLYAAVNYPKKPIDFMWGALEDARELCKYFTPDRIREHYMTESLASLFGSSFGGAPSYVFLQAVMAHPTASKDYVWKILDRMRVSEDSSGSFFSGVREAGWVEKFALDPATTAQQLVDYVIIPGHENQIDLVIETLRKTGQEEKLFQFERGLIQELPDRLLVLRHQEALEQLSPRRREVLTKLFIENKKPKQIVKELGIGVSAVSNYKIKGLELLRELVDPASDYQLVLRNRNLLNRLSPWQRLVLTKLYLENKIAVQIAKEFGINEKQVAIHKKKGLRKLRALLDPNSDYQLVLKNQELLDRLPPRQRLVLTRLYLENKTPKQITQELGISETAASNRKVRGLKSLRGLLVGNNIEELRNMAEIYKRGLFSEHKEILFIDVPDTENSGDIKVDEGKKIVLGSRDFEGCLAAVLTWVKKGEKYLWLAHHIGWGLGGGDYIRQKIDGLCESGVKREDIKVVVHTRLNGENNPATFENGKIARLVELSEKNVAVYVTPRDVWHDDHRYAKSNVIAASEGGVINFPEADRSSDKVILWGTMKVWQDVAKAGVRPGPDPEAGHPSGVMDAGWVENPFHFLKKRCEISSQDFLVGLSSKYGIRKVLKGGPIAQPDLFKAVRGPERSSDYDPRLMDPEDIIGFEAFVEGVIDGRIRAPLVYKPNGSARGLGIFFLENDGRGNTVITMAYVSEGRKEKDVILQEIKVMDGVEVMERHDQDIVQIVVDSTKKDLLASVLHKIEFAYTREMRFGENAFGIVEAIMPVIKYNGKAYETRHGLRGSLLTGQCILCEEEGRVEDSFARIGSSGYFSNQMGRNGPVRRLDQPEMFNPLYEMYGIEGSRQEEFKEYVHEKIKEEFFYLVERLRAAGINFDAEVQGQFDLMWLPPSKESNGLPVPVLIEAEFLSLDLFADWKKIVIEGNLKVGQDTTFPDQHFVMGLELSLGAVLTIWTGLGLFFALSLVPIAILLAKKIYNSKKKVSFHSEEIMKLSEKDTFTSFPRKRESVNVIDPRFRGDDKAVLGAFPLSEQEQAAAIEIFFKLLESLENLRITNWWYNYADLILKMFNRGLIFTERAKAVLDTALEYLEKKDAVGNCVDLVIGTLDKELITEKNDPKLIAALETLQKRGPWKEYADLVICMLDKGFITQKDDPRLDIALKGVKDRGEWLHYAELTLGMFNNGFILRKDTKKKIAFALKMRKKAASRRDYRYASFILKLPDGGFIEREQAISELDIVLKDLEYIGLWHQYTELVLEILNKGFIDREQVKARLETALGRLKKLKLWAGYADLLIKMRDRGFIAPEEAKAGLDIVQEALRKKSSHHEYADLVIKMFGESEISFLRSQRRKAQRIGIPYGYYLKTLELARIFKPTEGSLTKAREDVKGYIALITAANNRVLREEQKINLTNLQLYRLHGLANLQFISPRLTKELIYNHCQRGFLPLLEDDIKAASLLRPEYVVMLKRCMEALEARRPSVIITPSFMMQIINFANTSQHFEWGADTFTRALDTNTQEGIILNLGRGLIKFLADSFGIEVNLDEAQPIEGMLKDWNLGYFGAMVSASHRWSKEDAALFNLVIRTALEGKFHALLYPEEHPDAAFENYSKEERDLIDKIRAYNRNFIKQLEGLEVNAEPWLHPENIAPELTIKDTGYPRNWQVILKDFRRAFMDFEEWFRGYPLPEKDKLERELRGAKKSCGGFNRLFDSEAPDITRYYNLLSQGRSLNKLYKFLNRVQHQYFSGEVVPPQMADLINVVQEIQDYVALEEEKPKPLRMRFWKRQVGRDCVIANQVGSCTRLEQNARAIFEYLLDLGTIYLILEDPDTGQEKGYVRFFLGLNKQGEPTIFTDSADGAANAGQYEPIPEARAFIEKFAAMCGIEHVVPREAGIIAKVGDALTENYFHHSNIFIPAYEPVTRPGPDPGSSARAIEASRAWKRLAGIGGSFPSYVKVQEDKTGALLNRQAHVLRGRDIALRYAVMLGGDIDKDLIKLIALAHELGRLPFAHYVEKRLAGYFHKYKEIIKRIPIGTELKERYNQALAQEILYREIGFELNPQIKEDINNILLKNPNDISSREARIFFLADTILGYVEDFILTYKLAYKGRRIVEDFEGREEFLEFVFGTSDLSKIDALRIEEANEFIVDVSGRLMERVIDRDALTIREDALRRLQHLRDNFEKELFPNVDKLVDLDNTIAPIFRQAKDLLMAQQPADIGGEEKEQAVFRQLLEMTEQDLLELTRFRQETFPPVFSWIKEAGFSEGSSTSHPSGVMGVDQVRKLALDPDTTAQKLIDYLLPGHEWQIELVKGILREAGLTEKLAEFEKLLARFEIADFMDVFMEKMTTIHKGREITYTNDLKIDIDSTEVLGTAEAYSCVPIVCRTETGASTPGKIHLVHTTGIGGIRSTKAVRHAGDDIARYFGYAKEKESVFVITFDERYRPQYELVAEDILKRYAASRVLLVSVDDRKAKSVLAMREGIAINSADTSPKIRVGSETGVEQTAVLTWEEIDSVLGDKRRATKTFKELFERHDGEKEDEKIRTPDKRLERLKKKEEGGIAAQINDERYILMRLKRYLNEKSVNMRIDLSTAPNGKEDIEKTAELLASLVIRHGIFDLNVRYVFENDGSGEIVKALKGKLPEELLSRIDNPHEGGAEIEVILKDRRLIDEDKTKIAPNEYIVALESSPDDASAIMPNYTAASTMGLTLAALGSSNEKPDEPRGIWENALKVFKNIYMRYGKIKKEDDFTMKQLEFMVSGSSATKLYYTVRYSLPPIETDLVDRMIEDNNSRQLILQNA